MSGRIEVLSQETIDQIAAGEVIDRPSSVVKELTENAIDAGATAITVEIKEGGLRLIRITDNGSGIERTQVPTAFLRHATSKIKTAIDLLTVSSLGFRGEALSSIAAVSQVELITRTEDALCATRYCIEGGKEISNMEIGAPKGTTFFVRDLFYNTPARRKFLKSPITEGSYIAEQMVSFALSHPEISFQLIQNGKNRFYTTGTGDLKETCYSVFGREEVKAFLLLEKFTGKENISISGYIAKPDHSRGNRCDEYYFINGRMIKSKVISKAIEDAYHGFLMQHRYPVTVLSLEVPAHLIDVNVHPSKMEIRFREEATIYEIVTKAIRNRLQRVELIPHVPIEEKKEDSKPKPCQTIAPEPFMRERVISSMVREAPMSYGSATSADEITVLRQETLPASTPFQEPTEKMQQPKQEQQMTLFEEKMLSKEARSKHKLIGQLFDTYWLIQYEDKFFIMDQHAAHEKVLFEKNVKMFREKTAVSQMVCPPIVLSLRPRELDMLRTYQELFASLGYELEEFGMDTYAIRAVPSNLYHLNQQTLLQELLADMTENAFLRRDLSEHTSKWNLPALTDKLASMSCKAAVKANMTLSFAEADALIEQLLLLDNPYMCPHGRPTLISMTKYEIEKKFSRKL